MSLSLNHDLINTCTFQSVLYFPIILYYHTVLQISRHMNTHTPTHTHLQAFCLQADSQQHGNKQQSLEPGLSCEILSSAVIEDMCLVTGING